MKKELLTERDDIFVIRNFLSDEECSQHIMKCEAKGFDESTISTPSGAVINKKMRSNDRVIIDDVSVASALWQRLKEFIPGRGALKPIGLNERLRYYRYEADQQFDWHFDGSFRRSAYEFSNLTFMVYLNDGFEGGTTDFNFKVGVVYDTDPVVTCVPEAGMALIFVHNVFHRGAPVLSGRKYVLRSDVMFCKKR